MGDLDRGLSDTIYSLVANLTKITNMNVSKVEESISDLQDRVRMIETQGVKYRDGSTLRVLIVWTAIVTIFIVARMT